MFDLSGKKALVTGSTQGIGLAIAKCLAEHGAQVYINGVESYEKCETAIKIVPNSKMALCDLSKNDCAEKLYEITGDIDILILNASIQYRTAWKDIPSEEFDKQIKVNFKSSVELIQKYAPYMQKNSWGRIITVGSVQQYKPHKDMLVYAASKCAQMSMVKNLAKQFAAEGVTVNNLNPGVVITPRNTVALADKEYAKNVLAGIPVGYAGEPEDMVGAALLLCSDEGRYITGTEILVDGGMSL